MSKIVNTIIGAGFAFVAANFAKRWLPGDWFQGIELDGINLSPPDLRPGPWYCYYLGDYLTAHPTENVVHSSPLELTTGVFIWATSTPEWDREWFEKRGFEFPAQWIPYSEIEGLAIPMRAIG